MFQYKIDGISVVRLNSFFFIGFFHYDFLGSVAVVSKRVYAIVKSFSHFVFP